MVTNQLKFAIYVVFHPFKGFWDMKFEQRGRALTALAALLILTATVIVKRQYTGFVVNPNNLDTLNSLDELKFVVLPFLLWCVANWSITTLMDGEGKFSGIIMATGYAIVPMILVYLPQTLFSNLITLEEGAFYSFFNSLAFLWMVWLLFIGTMTVHQYSVTKTIFTMLLTLLVIGIILFLGLLFFSLIQQIVSFCYTIYKELSMRS